MHVDLKLWIKCYGSEKHYNLLYLIKQINGKDGVTVSSPKSYSASESLHYQSFTMLRNKRAGFFISNKSINQSW